MLNISKRLFDNFGEPILELAKVIDYLRKNENSTQNLEINLSNSIFLSPIFLAGLAALYQDRQFSLNTKFMENSLAYYAKAIEFPNMYDITQNNSSNTHQTLFEKYRYKTYLPIIKFPTARIASISKLRDDCFSTVNELIKNQLKLPIQILQGIYYLIDEITNNVLDHSKKDFGYLMLQYYPTKQYMDLCIIDNGVGILGSYQINNHEDIITEKQAFESAFEGISTKPYYQSRGFGLHTSRKMLTQGFKGNYMIWSGKTALINQEIVLMPAIWQGTLAYMRIPTVANPTFSTTNFYE